jgi:hypothetical protein
LCLVALQMDTTVGSGSYRVHNIGLQHKQLLLLVFGSVMFLAGIVLFGIHKVKQTPEEEKEEARLRQEAVAKAKTRLQDFLDGEPADSPPRSIAAPPPPGSRQMDLRGDLTDLVRPSQGSTNIPRTEPDRGSGYTSHEMEALSERPQHSAASEPVRTSPSWHIKRSHVGVVGSAAIVASLLFLPYEHTRWDDSGVMKDDVQYALIGSSKEDLLWGHFLTQEVIILLSVLFAWKSAARLERRNAKEE